MIKYLWKKKIAKRKQVMDNKKLYDYGIKDPVKKLNEVVEMEIKAEKAIKLEDGKYSGEITDVEFREEPFAYTDILIKENKSKLVLKCGVPTKITEDTQLGMLLENFGVKIEVGKKYDVQDLLTGKKVEFMVINKKTEKGSFCNIIPTSLKPTK